jgi:hypothetical protein
MISGNQALTDRIAQLVDHREVEDEDPFIARRLDGCQRAPSRCLRSSMQNIGGVPGFSRSSSDTCKRARRRVGGDKQTEVSAVTAQDEQNVGAVGLVDAIDAGAGRSWLSSAARQRDDTPSKGMG